MDYKEQYQNDEIFRKKELKRLSEYVRRPEVKERRKILRKTRYVEKNKIRNITIKFLLKELKGKCNICYSIDNLQIHHWRYDKPLIFSILCRKCHNIIHSKKEVKK